MTTNELSGAAVRKNENEIVSSIGREEQRVIRVPVPNRIHVAEERVCVRRKAAIQILDTSKINPGENVETN